MSELQTVPLLLWFYVYDLRDSSSQSGLAIGSIGIFPGSLTIDPFSNRQRFGSGRIGLAENPTPCSCSREKTHPPPLFFFVSLFVTAVQRDIRRVVHSVRFMVQSARLVKFGCPVARTQFAQNGVKYDRRGNLQTGYSY